MTLINLSQIDDVRAQNEQAMAFAEGFSVGADPKGRYRERKRYAERYGERYGKRYGVGQSTAAAARQPRGPGSYAPRTAGPGPTAPPSGGGGGGGDCGPYTTQRGGAGHGRRVVYEDGYSCAIRPPRCECQVIGGNTLNSTQFPTGIASGAFGTVTLDSGDASYFVPYFMHIVALEVGATANLSVTGTALMVLMQDSKSGQEPNMRRASTTNQAFGVPTLVYGQEKELECVDWNRFASVNNQQLLLTFNNPNTVAVHIFVDLWGLVAA